MKNYNGTDSSYFLRYREGCTLRKLLLNQMSYGIWVRNVDQVYAQLSLSF